ncbi:MAG: ribokinase [Anaerolineaceae bacterium]|nr:ribokinase [Anaerolineaceae bacterium]
MKLAVVGSMNLDITLVVERMPVLGETLRSQKSLQSPGGKGANQAVAAARSGAEVFMFGQLGNDPYAGFVMENFKANRINTQGILTDPESSTGLAFIFVEGGDNRILLASGANDRFLPAQLESLKQSILSCDALLLQNEIPVESIAAAVSLCKGKIPIFLNPAPAMPYLPGTLEGLDYFIPNEYEFEFYTHQSLENMHAIEKGLQFLQTMGVKEPLITMGTKGVAYLEDGQARIMPGFKVQVIDSTGAGDTFSGAFACRRMAGDALPEAIRYAQAAAALACTKLGAQSAIPCREEVTAFLLQAGK